MANLLPPIIEIAQRRRAWFLLVQTTGLVVIVVGVIGILAILPALITERAAREALTAEQVVLAEAVEARQARPEMQGLAQTREQVEVLATQFSDDRAVFAAIEEALARRPAGVSVRSITYTHRDAAGSLVLAGVAESRAQLTAYETALEQHDQFDSVRIPITALAQAEGGAFTITISGSF